MNDLMQFVKVLFYSEFSLTSFGTLTYGCVIKTIEMFNFLPLINNSITNGLSFLLFITLAIISSKAINNL